VGIVVVIEDPVPNVPDEPEVPNVPDVPFPTQMDGCHVITHVMLIKAKGSGSSSMMNISQMEVYDCNDQLAPVESGDVYPLHNNLNGKFLYDGDITTHAHTNNEGAFSYFAIKLGVPISRISKVVIVNRQDGAPDRILGARVLLLSSYKLPTSGETASSFMSKQVIRSVTPDIDTVAPDYVFDFDCGTCANFISPTIEECPGITHIMLYKRKGDPASIIKDAVLNIAQIEVYDCNDQLVPVKSGQVYPQYSSHGQQNLYDGKMDTMAHTSGSDTFSYVVIQLERPVYRISKVFIANRMDAARDRIVGARCVLLSGFMPRVEGDNVETFLGRNTAYEVMQVNLLTSYHDGYDLMFDCSICTEFTGVFSVDFDRCPDITHVMLYKSTPKDNTMNVVEIEVRDVNDFVQLLEGEVFPQYGTGYPGSNLIDGDLETMGHTINNPFTYFTVKLAPGVKRISSVKVVNRNTASSRILDSKVMLLSSFSSGAIGQTPQDFLSKQEIVSESDLITEDAHSYNFMFDPVDSCNDFLRQEINQHGVCPLVSHVLFYKETPDGNSAMNITDFSVNDRYSTIPIASAGLSVLYTGYPASNMIDGNPNTFAHTMNGEAYSYFVVELETPVQSIKSVEIGNRERYENRCIGGRVMLLSSFTHGFTGQSATDFLRGITVIRETDKINTASALYSFNFNPTECDGGCTESDCNEYLGLTTYGDVEINTVAVNCPVITHVLLYKVRNDYVNADDSRGAIMNINQLEVYDCDDALIPVESGEVYPQYSSNGPQNLYDGKMDTVAHTTDADAFSYFVIKLSRPVSRISKVFVANRPVARNRIVGARLALLSGFVSRVAGDTFSTFINKQSVIRTEPAIRSGQEGYEFEYDCTTCNELVTVNDVVLREMTVDNVWRAPSGIPDLGTTPPATYGDKIFHVWKDSELRARVTMTLGGTNTTVYLDPKPDYITSGDSHNAFCIGVDTAGYIHIIGDMHNHRIDSHIPARYHKATSLYWCSTRPGDITEFEFRGNHPTKKMPTNENTYVSIHSDRRGVLYYLCRVRHPVRHSPGKVGLGLYRYDVSTQRWTALGGYPDFSGYEQSSLIKMIVWEDDGHSDAGGWYQHAMAHINFDLDNNLHLATVWNNDRTKIKSTDLIHALSRDGGDTWVKMGSNTPIRLPLRVDNGPNQADVVSHGFDGLELANGSVSVLVDKYGSPGIFLQPYDPNEGRTPLRYIRWLRDQKTWSSYYKLPGWYWQRPSGFVTESGVLTVARTGGSGVAGIWLCDDNDIVNGSYYRTGINLASIDGKLARETGILIGCHVRQDRGYDVYIVTPRPLI